MANLYEAVASWHNFLLVILIFGFAPGFVLRVIVTMYPKGDPRRQELIAELYVLSRLKRVLYVAEQLETALFEGLPLRAKALRRKRSRAKSAKSSRGLDSVVIGPRGGLVTLREVMTRTKLLSSSIELDENAGSLRHRTVSARLKWFSLLSLIVIDFPLILWVTSSVFDVNWNAPLNAPLNLMISVVMSILATGGADGVLYHLGRDHRRNKTHQRRLVWKELLPGSKASLLAVATLVVLLAGAMFERVHTEGVLIGLSGFAVLLAILVSFVMMVAASLVYFIAFRDGSPEQDDLAYLSALVKGQRGGSGHSSDA